MKLLIGKETRLPALGLVASLAWAAGTILAGCSDDDDDDGAGNTGNTGGTGADEDVIVGEFECEDGRDGWEMCVNDEVRYCHIVEGMDPHFHGGIDCASDGLTCVVNDEHEAACVDPNTSCNEGEFKCEDNTAYNCVDGNWAMRACGTAAECHEEEDEAHCHAHEDEGGEECGGHGHLDGDECHCDEFYEVDADDATVCILADPPGLACDAYHNHGPHAATAADSAAGSLNPDAHAELLERIDVTLLEGQQSFIHFPVTETGDYVVMMSAADVLVGVADAEGTLLTTADDKAGANPQCDTELVEHWHAHLEYTGDGTDPVPHVLEFNPTDDNTVSLVIFFAGHEHDE
jgi:hypothetical protein